MKKQQERIRNYGGTLNLPVVTHGQRRAQAPQIQCVQPAQQSHPPDYVPTTLPETIRNIPDHTEVSEAVRAFTAGGDISQKPVGKTSSTNSWPRLSRKAKKKAAAAKSFVPVPKGAPLFMFQGVGGKTRSVNWFYDTGCSYLVMKNDIPDKEYDSTLLQKGPFSIGGVGGIRTVAHDEFVISVKRCDGRMQHFQGVTVDKVTSEFPLINLEVATAEVKGSDPENRVLQLCSVPPSVSGHVDVLCGIQFISGFPELVHMLDSGLGIYKSKLSSHDKQWTALLGGPHVSFEHLAQQVGNVSQLLANFVDGLRTFRTSGPPRLSRCPMTVEEELFAKAMNATDTDVQEIKDIATLEAAELLYEKMAETDDHSSQKPGQETVSRAKLNLNQRSSDRFLIVQYCPECSLAERD